MKLEKLLAILAGVLIPLNTLTFGYVLSIEKRLTRLETIQEMRGGRPSPSPATRA